MIIISHHIKELPNDARKIPNTMNWVDKKGNVYGIETRMISNRFHEDIKTPHKHYGEYFKYNTTINKHNGYVYVSIKYIIDKNNNKYENRQRRVHILVAEAFLENPYNYPIVGHRNNIKTDNRVENLYWTTWKENTQKAVTDGLLVNDKSYNDSQSKPVVMFNTHTNVELGRYGSISEAARETGISKNTILRQAKYKRPVRKDFYFRFQDDETATPPTIIIQYDLKTHEEIGHYYNSWDAERKTNINSRVILDQCHKNKIPQWTKSGTYFRYG